MTSNSEGLTRLHRLHQQLEEVENELAEGPRRIDVARRTTSKRDGERDEQKQAITDMQKAADEKQLQLKTNEAKITELKVKLNSAATNREYSIIQSQIEADSVANSVLEDEILEAFDKVDTARQKLAALEDACASAREQEKQIAAEVASSEPEQKSSAEQLRAAIKDAESIIEGQTRETYDRLVQAHGAGAMAAVDGKACGSCYTVMSPQEGVQLNLGKFIFCRACGRLLYKIVGDD